VLAHVIAPAPTGVSTMVDPLNWPIPSTLEWVIPATPVNWSVIKNESPPARLCASCQLFCRSLVPGGHCPERDHAILVSDLLE
jgi:hypothetical protein